MDDNINIIENLLSFSDEYEWLKTTIKEEYKNAVNHLEYRHFLKAKFPSFIVDN